MRKRRSLLLGQLKRELHQRALKEKNEEKRTDYWRMYFKAESAEGEVRELVLEAEVRRLVEFLAMHGYVDDLPDEADGNKPNDNPPENPFDDDDIPPRQKGLWDE